MFLYSQFYYASLQLYLLLVKGKVYVFSLSVLVLLYFCKLYFLKWNLCGVKLAFEPDVKGGGGVASFAHALILIWRSLYIFRILRRKISVKTAVKCQTQSVISTWMPCYNQSFCSVWDTSVACNTSHITHFVRRYSHCLPSYNY